MTIQQTRRRNSCNLLFGAGIRLRRAFTLERYRNACLADRQQTFIISNRIVGRNCTRFIGSPAFIDHVRLRTHICDCAFCRHGYGEVCLRVTIDQAADFKITLRERSIIIRLVGTPGRNSQGNFIVNRNDIAADRNGYALRLLIAGNLRCLIRCVQRSALIRR